MERAGYIAETVGNAVPAFVEGLQQAQNRKELTTGTPDERYAAAGRLLDSYGAEKLPAEVRQGLSEQIGQLAIKDPQAAAAATEIMHRLLGQDAMKQNFAQVLLEGALAAALGAALIATTPQGQEAWAKVAPELSSSVREDVQKLALYLILLQPGSPVSPTDLRFPIFQPDSLPLVTPSVDPTLWKPGSGGYGADGKVELPSSTGGSDIQQNGAWDTGAQSGQLPSPGLVFNEDRPDLTTNPKHVPGGNGFRPNAGIQPADYAEAYQGSIKVGGAWWGVSTDGKSIYRYFDSRDGTVHWAGSTGDQRNPLKQKDVPPEVLRTFGFKVKGSKSPW